MSHLKICHIEKFSFRFVTLEDSTSIIKDLKNNQAAGGDTLLKLLKECDFTYEQLTCYIIDVLFEVHLIFFSPRFIVHMFYLISLSPHVIDHASFLFPLVHSPSHLFHPP